MRFASIAKAVLIDYTNWRGERKKYHIIPTGRVEFENNEWHQETQWLLEADVVGGNRRQFAMKDIHSWESCNA